MKKGFLSEKKGVSNIIGYILLIAIVIAISIIVYQWLRTYVPSDAIECSDGTSISIDSYIYNCDTNTLNLTLKNNGRFDIGGYYIYGTTSESQELATADLSPYTEMGGDGVVVFDANLNYLAPNGKISNSFAINLTNYSRIYSLDIFPVRYQDYNGKNILVNCGGAKIRETLSCSVNATPEAVCGDGVIEGGELCDDSNSNSGDGCSSSCAVEANWQCTGEPSVCVAFGFLSANYSNLQKDTGSNPYPAGCGAGCHWWYFTSTLSETGGLTGITADNRQKCYSDPTGDYCDPVRTDFSCWGTNYISNGSSIICSNNYIYTYESSLTLTEIFNGTDDNGHAVSSSYSFTVSA